MRAAGALNQGRVIDPDAINTLIEETVALLHDDLPATHPYASIEVRPRPAQMPEVWLLGSSGQSAAWAGAHDLNYAYAQFFTGRQQVEIMNHYRAHLPESPGTRVDGAPGGVVSSGPGSIHGGQTLSALCVSAAATREEAHEQALVAADARFSLRTGRPMHFRDPATLDAAYRAEVERYLERDTAIIVGTYDEVAPGPCPPSPRPRHRGGHAHQLHRRRRGQDPPVRRARLPVPVSRRSFVSARLRCAREGSRAGRLPWSRWRAEGRGLLGHWCHGADITLAPTPHAEDKPQHSRDPLWPLRLWAR